MSTLGVAGYEPGQQIDGWTVDRVLGHGGMGSVYQCHNSGAPRIVAAIKTMRVDPARTSFQRRFVQEAELLFSLEHPNIVKVRNVRLDHAPAYIEMDYVEGQSIEDHLQRGALPQAQALRLFAQLVDAVAYLHRRNVQHRDIKPANLLVTPDGRLVLVDFGLARDGVSPRITQTDVIFGTVSYAPPEWIVPSRLNPARWDVYAIGVVLYEMLTGEEAFPCDESQGNSTAQAVEVMTRKLGGNPLDPGPDFPFAIRRMVQRMTDPIPEQRPSSAIELLSWVTGLDIPDWSPSTHLPNTTAPSIARAAAPTYPPTDHDIVGQWIRDAESLPRPGAGRRTTTGEHWLGTAATMFGLAGLSVGGFVAVVSSWLLTHFL